MSNRFRQSELVYKWHCHEIISDFAPCLAQDTFIPFTVRHKRAVQCIDRPMCFVQCKIGKVIGNLTALQQLLPQTVDTVAVIQYMPTLLLSDMKKVCQTHISICLKH